LKFLLSSDLFCGISPDFIVCPRHKSTLEFQPI
jgi:hypothetical protein